MSRYGNYYGGWAPYVPVAQRRANARRDMAKRLKAGQAVEPVNIEGRKIASSFWGKGWCDHLDSFGDYSNRLPRGRTYVRNGSVCHLAIQQGKVEAFVSGSDLYRVDVKISALKPAKWKKVKQACTGKIGSLMELLQGRLSEEIMGAVTNDKEGLFPRPGEIEYSCNCPDWAGMCKHIAAVIYGIGARLDSRPELLFLLRGVDHEELITADAATQTITGKPGSRRRLTSAALADVFGIELDSPGTTSEVGAKTKRKDTAARKHTAAKRKTTPRPAQGKTESPDRPFKPTARKIAALRRRHGMSRADLAEVLDVSLASVNRWENATGKLKLNEKSSAGLTWLSQQEVATS